MSKKKNRIEPIAPSESPSTPTLHQGAVRVVTLMASFHLCIAAFMVVNYASHQAPINDALHAQFAWQAGEGHRLYGPEDVHIQELWYTPLTFQITGFLSKPFGYDIRVMRFSVAIFGCSAIVLIGLITYRLTGNRWLSFMASALFSGIDAGAWYTYLEPNAIHVFFAALSLYILLRDPDVSWRTVVLLSLSLFASFWSKQTAFVYIAAGILYVSTRSVKKGLATAALTCGLVTAGILYYHLQPGSSFMAETMSHGNHPIVWDWLLTPALFPELFGRFGALIAVIIFGLFIRTTKLQDLFRPEYIFLGAAAAIGIMARLKYGSGSAQAIMFYGLIIACGLAFLNDLYKNNVVPGAFVLSVLAVQSFTLVHNFQQNVITKYDDQRYRQVLDIMRTPGKSTYYVNQGYYNILAGKEPFAAVGRDCWYKGKYDRSRYPIFWRKFLESDPFDIVVIDVPLEDNSWLLYERLNQNYVPVREINFGDKAHNKQVVFYRKDQMPQAAGSKPPGGS